MSTAAASMSFFRPKRIIRPMRRQIPVFWLVGGVVAIGSLFVAVAWRNLSHERLDREVSKQWSQIEFLEKEIKHLEGKVKNETAVSKIQPWARDQRGWRKNEAAVRTLVISSRDLTPGALQESRTMGSSHD
ncbi:hypothetical protein HZB60_08910 [candidate division KSB1 bacterium]|nr:hypothetical protein [candidate division KSB1 bacterium]